MHDSENPVTSALARSRIGRRRNRIRGIGPEHARQVVQRDRGAPAVGRRPDRQRHQHCHQREAEDGMRADDAEIDQDDHRANGQPIPDDREGPRIAGITCEDQAAD